MPFPLPPVGRDILLAKTAARPVHHEITTPPADDVEGRREEEAEQRHPQHSEKHGDTQGLAHLGAGPWLITSGRTPRMKAIEVIRMGRKR